MRVLAARARVAGRWMAASLVLSALCLSGLSCRGGRGEEETTPIASLGPPPSSHAPAAYAASIVEWRRRKDAFFRASPESPVPPPERQALPPLDYYPVDPSWRLTLAVERYETPQVFELVTNMGEKRRYRREGQVRFTREGVSASLQLYREVEPSGESAMLWVPFTDSGAGRETYPAGRYLDVESAADGTVVLDFNFAYNPYCAYGWAYSCPMTPPENRLKLAVRAGERGYHRPAM